jgi:uncharacterized integral membrane protein
MQFFYWLVFAMVIGVAIFAIQNSSAPLIVIKVFFWRFETSLLHTLLGSVGIGVLITLFFWIPKAIKHSIRSKELKKQIKNLEAVLYRPSTLGQEGIKAKEP